jgi:hypothetical protein
MSGETLEVLSSGVDRNEPHNFDQEEVWFHYKDRVGAMTRCQRAGTVSHAAW